LSVCSALESWPRFSANPESPAATPALASGTSVELWSLAVVSSGIGVSPSA
jgi:hypothetical protein